MLDRSLTLDGLADKELLELVQVSQRLQTRAKAAAMLVLAELDRRGTCETSFGIDTAAWLAQQQHLARGTAAADVRAARKLVDVTPVVADALCRAELTERHAEAISYGLSLIPLDLPPDDDVAVQVTLVGYARQFTPTEVRRLTNRAVEVAAPDAFDAYQARRLEAQEAAARRSRSLTWRLTEYGTMQLRAALTAEAGEKVIATLSAVADTCGVDTEDLPAAPVSARRADALVRVVNRFTASGQAPGKGGDRPRINITVDIDVLRTGLGEALLVGTDEPISPATARRLACDADLLPVVLGTKSVILDAGRTHRLFNGPLRAAITVRDRGCTFPGCDRPPIDCEIHHIIPWWAGGRTCLANAAMLCPHHHHLVEPQPNAPPGTRWEVRHDARGTPEYLPPAALDPARRPRQHARFADPGLAA